MLVFLAVVICLEHHHELIGCSLLVVRLELASLISSLLVVHPELSLNASLIFLGMIPVSS